MDEPSCSKSQDQPADDAGTSLKTEDETSGVDESDEPIRKRARRPPPRFSNNPLGLEAKRDSVLLKTLTEELRSWSETNLIQVSEHLQWKRNASNEEIASLVGKTKRDVDRLMNLLEKTDWKHVVLSNGFTSGILVNKDDELKNEKPLDFWYQLSSMLTPRELDNSDQLASVMRDLAESADDEYGPIYEYLAVIMDDPAATANMQPRLTGIQAGIVLEILHSMAIAVKESAHVHSLLQKRAVAVLKGDWDALKMPGRRSDKSDPSQQRKRVSLYGLNPFAMPRDALPAATNRPPVSVDLDLPSSARPMPSDLRSITQMNKIKQGFRTMDMVHEEPVEVRHGGKSLFVRPDDDSRDEEPAEAADDDQRPIQLPSDGTSL